MFKQFNFYRYWRYLSGFGQLALLAVVLAGCEAKPTQPVTSTPRNEVKKKPFCEVAAQIEFQEVAKEAGVVFQYEDGGSAKLFTMPETIGGGVAVWDFDLDGNLDLAFAGGGTLGPQERQITGRPLALFRNSGKLQFQEVTTGSHADQASGYSHGTIVGDYNADGFPDLLITGYGGLQLWKNLGDGTFENATAQAGLTDSLWSTSAAFADFNGDGHADLYVAHYVNWSFDNNPLCTSSGDSQQQDFCSPRAFEPLNDTLYIGNGDGTFRDGSKEAGLVDGGKGLGVIASDLDNDGDVDIYVANDTTANFLYLNDGKGHFQELGELNGAAVDDSGTPNGSMGVDVIDYNRDGLPDIWVANFERESFALYANLGDGAFLHSSRTTGIAALNELYVAFGTQTDDFDLDGDEDFVVTNGHILQYPTGIGRKQEPLLLLSDKGFFRRAEFDPNSFFSKLHEGRGLAAGDLDNDGDFDVAISHINEPVALLRNDKISSTSAGKESAPSPRHAPRWVSLQLIGTQSHRDAVGARVTLHTSKGDLTRWQRGGCSYCSSPAPQVHFGIPHRAEVTGLTIHWPGGEKQELPAPTLNAQTKLLEPTSP
ncbi:MAG: CRTAC1 family protein [Planctomycetaceae bacterium]